MKLLAWSIEENEQDTYINAKYLIESAKVFDQQVEFIGVGKKFGELFDKITILREYIDTLSENTFLVCIDGYDTLINKDLSTLKNEFDKLSTEIIISSEKIFTYQWNTFKDKFDTIESPYRYVNSGTIIGFSDAIKNMLDECLELHKNHKTTIDQGVVGVWVYENFENKHKVVLDTNTRFTWVVSGEWNVLKEASKNLEIINPTSGNKPFIIHSPGNGIETHYLSFLEAYKSIIAK